MAYYQSDLIEVKKVRGKGRGVFARKRIPEGTIFERVPVLVIDEEDIDTSILMDYVYIWNERSVALALGYGSMYNHSYQPNAIYEDAAPQTKLYIALRDIEPGEEITINYNADPTDQSPVDFDVK